LVLDLEITMKITKIESYILESAISESFGWSQDWTDKRFATITRISTDEGIIGWGEGSCLAGTTVIRDLFAPLLIGEDPRNINRHWNRMFASLYNADLAGGFGGDAISCVDIALWDIAGKAAGKSISELLGGALREKVAVYATGLYYRKDEMSGKLADEAASYVQAGFRGMKTKIGGLSMKEDVARVAMIRETIGDDIFLMVDANKAYNSATACTMGRELVDLDIHWFEEPVYTNDVDAYLRVRDGQPIPVAGGEVIRNRFEARDFIAKRAVDILQPDVNLAGGITEFRNTAMMAHTFGIRVNPHLWGTPLMTSATISIAATLPPCPFAFAPRPYEREPVVEFDRTPHPIRDELCNQVFVQKNGYIDLPTGPGLGVEVNEEVLNKYCVGQIST
jgi:D-galactarolactone cycloisomerase